MDIKIKENDNKNVYERSKGAIEKVVLYKAGHYGFYSFVDDFCSYCNNKRSS